MSCERYAEAIADHACGADLPAGAAAHLRECARCTALFDEQRRLIGDLDGELQAALAVAPSVQFAPRVRAAIEAAPAPGRRNAMFWWAGLAAAAAAAFVVSMWPGDRLSVPPAPARPVAARANPDVIPPREETPPPASPEKRPGPRAPIAGRANAAGSIAAKTAPPVEPEIIVSQDQQRAVARFVALVRTGELDTSSLVPRPDGEIGPPAELAVSPLAVSPIVVPSVEFRTDSAVNDGAPKGVELR